MTDSDERRKMALQINPNSGAPLVGNEAKVDAPSIGTPNQDAANQLADLLKNPAEDSNSAPAGSPFASPFNKAAQNPDKTSAENTPSPFGAPAKSEAKTASDAKPSNPATPTEQGASTAQSSTSQGAKEGAATNTASPFAAQTKPESKTAPEAQGIHSSMNAKSETLSASATSFSNQVSAATSTSTSSLPNSPMSTNTSGVGTPAQSQPAISGEIKESAKPGSESLSDAQLAAAASMNTAVGVQATGGTVASAGVEEVAQPRVDGEKIEAMMKSVTKELGMRDLSNLKLGGEMTLKLDQGALPNTEVKVRFEGNEMVISIDSKTADVNQFCTDNLALLQQSVSSGMKEDMKVRIEVRNPPDQPNQRKEGEGGQSGQGGQSSGGQGGNQDRSSQQQTQNPEGESL